MKSSPSSSSSGTTAGRDASEDSSRITDPGKLGADLFREHGQDALEMAIDRATAAIVAGDEAEVERRVRVVEAIERELSAGRKAAQQQ